MGTVQQVHFDASGIPVVCMPIMYVVVCLARSAAKLSHVGWRLTRQVPKGRRNSGVRRRAWYKMSMLGPTIELADGWPKGILSALLSPPWARGRPASSAHGWLFLGPRFRGLCRRPMPVADEMWDMADVGWYIYIF